jgi:hypothetical protein
MDSGQINHCYTFLCRYAAGTLGLADSLAKG